MITRTSAILLTCLLALSAAAQDAAHTFRNAVVKHELYLRDFSADSQVRGHWDAAANTLVMDTAKIHSLVVFRAKSAKVKSDGFEIKGDSQTLVRDTATHFALSPDKAPMTIWLDLSGADMNTVLPVLFSKLFYADQAEALAGLPKIYQRILPMKANDKCCGELPRSPRPPSTCDCADPGLSQCMAHDGAPPKGAKPPHVIYQVDPAFSEKARRARFSGKVQIGFTLDTAGIPHDLWIIRRAGMGLDDQAAEAVSQYRFAPATCNGNPIPTSLSVDVNFTIF